MKVVIVGVGRTGFLIAKWLSMNHEVTVIDRNPEILDEITYMLDVLAINGDATLPEVLKKADVDKADYVIATTDNDQTNIIVSALSKTLGNPFTIARVKRMEYLKVWGYGRKTLGVDLMVCAAPLVAEGIVRVVDYPQLLFFRKLYGDIYVGMSDSSTENLWSLRINDKNLIIATKEMIELSFKKSRTKKVLILGVGEIGKLIAKMLSAKGKEVKLVENNAEKAREIADELNEINVIFGDVFSDFLWSEENLGEADVSIITLNQDHECFFASAISKERGIDRVFSVVHRSSHMSLFEKIGVIPFSPELETAGKITAAIKEKATLGVVTKPEFQVYALSGDHLEGTLLKDLPGIPGPFFRKNKLISPNPNLRLKKGDVAIVITEGGGMIL
ncbi:NAD-binding protein [Thermococcus sp.]